MRTKFLILMLFISIATMAQGQNQTFTGWTKFLGALQDPTATRVLVMDEETGKTGWVLKSSLSNETTTAITVNTITELENYSGFGLTLIVKDERRGGIFNYVGVGTVDNGNVFNATGKGSGYWQRQYNQSEALNLLWFGVNENNADNSVLIEDVISNIGGKIFLPKGNYKIQNTIGDVGDSGTKFITKDTYLYGEEGTTILVENPVTAEISSVIGFNMLGAKLEIHNILLEANNISNRGIYVRQVDVNPDALYSNIKVNNVKVKDIYIGADFKENSGAGIYVYGKFESIDIIDCKIDDIVASNATRAVAGIFTSGTASVNRLPKYVNISNNIIKGVYRDGFVNQTDQDGIACLYDLTVLGGQADSKFTIENNKIINAGGRFVKAQQQNGFLNNNFFIIESGFEMPATNTSYGVDLQVSEGVVSNNVFSYNQTTGVSHLAAINFTERTQDTSLHRAIIENNKVFSTPVLPQFCRLIESGNMTGQYVVNSNVVIAPLSNFMNFSSTSSATNVRKFIFSDNTVGSLTTNWINNENSKTIEISLTNNRNNGTSVTVSNVYSKANLIDNIGITEANTYATVTALNLKANEGEVIKTTNTGTPVTAYSSLNANNITGTNIIYATSGTNIPVAGGLLQTNIYATGGAQMYQRFASEDEFYYRNKTGGTWSSNWYRIASREWSNLNFVGLTGNQTVAGIKTFSSSPIVPTATTSGQAVPLGQLNTAISGLNLQAVLNNGSEATSSTNILLQRSGSNGSIGINTSGIEIVGQGKNVLITGYNTSIGGGNLTMKSSSGDLNIETNSGDRVLINNKNAITSIDGIEANDAGEISLGSEYVPYTDATNSLDLGAYGLTAGAVTSGTITAENTLQTNGSFHINYGSNAATISPSSITSSRVLNIPDKDGTFAVTTDLPQIITGSGFYDFGNMSAGDEKGFYIDVPGAYPGDVVAIGMTQRENFTYNAAVISPGTVSVRVRCFAGSTVNVSGINVTVKIFK